MMAKSNANNPSDSGGVFIASTDEYIDAEKTLAQAYHIQCLVSSLLSASLQTDNLTELLESALRMCFRAPYMLKEAKGIIYLAKGDEGKDQVLIKAASAGFSQTEILNFKTVQFGTGNCGKSAVEQSIQISSTPDIQLEGKPPFKIQICAPILLDRDTLGMIDIYSTKPLSLHEGTGALLCTLSDTLAAIIKIKLGDEALRAAHQKLEDTSNQLLQAEKMAAIGQLAAGMAHEINNPISFLNSNLGALEKYANRLYKLVSFYETLEPDLPQAAQMALNNIKQEINLKALQKNTEELLAESREGIIRIRNIVQDLKDFSRMDRSEWEWADLHAGIESALNIVNNEIQYRAEVIKNYGNLPEVECMAFQLNQVFMSLLLNAAQSMHEYGAITITTGCSGNEVWVMIEDNGCGIQPRYLNKIFDPFFTTKEIGKGMGLGLSLSYGIVQQHHGRIEVESKPGKGSCFLVVIPIRQKQP